MEKCCKCEMALEKEEDKCLCNDTLCVHCCECEKGCGCQCKEA